jgi:hypothetical protein
MVGVVGIIMFSAFLNSSNTDALDDTTLLILGVIPTFLGLGMLFDALRSILGFGSKGN